MVDRAQADLLDLPAGVRPENVIRDQKHMERFQSAIEFWDLTNRQDWHVCEQMQLGLKSSRFKRGLYSGQEDILFALDREVLARSRRL